MSAETQESPQQTIRESDLKNECFRLNRILAQLGSRITTLEAAQKSLTAAIWTKYGRESERPNVSGLPDGALFIATDTITLFELRNNRWVRIFWRATASLSAQTGSIAVTSLQETTGVVAPAGLYEFQFSMITTTAGAAGNNKMYVLYTEPSGTAIAANIGQIDLATLGNISYGSLLIRTNGVGNIQYSTVFTPGAGAQYRLEVVVRAVAL